MTQSSAAQHRRPLPLPPLAVQGEEDGRNAGRGVSACCDSRMRRARLHECAHPSVSAGSAPLESEPTRGSAFAVRAPRRWPPAQPTCISLPHARAPKQAVCPYHQRHERPRIVQAWQGCGECEERARSVLRGAGAAQGSATPSWRVPLPWVHAFFSEQHHQFAVCAVPLEQLHHFAVHAFPKEQRTTLQFVPSL